MKRLFTLLPLILFALTVSAADGDVKKTTVDGIEWTYNVVSETDKSCDLGGYTSNDAGDAVYYPAIDVNITGALSIPSTLDGYTVGSIGIECFRGCKITSVTIPEGVTNIGDYAFTDCSNLEKVICNGQPYDISEKAFEGLTDQVTVYFPVDLGEQFHSRTGWNKLSKWFEQGVEERKQTLTEQMYAIENELAYLANALSEKATESEAPELYDEFKDLQRRVHEIRYRIEDARTMEVVSRELSPALEEIRARLEYLAVKIENYQPSKKIAINEETFPDANFRNWVLATDYGKDSVLTEEEIAGVTFINVESQNISNLTGIEYFTALSSLWCGGNQLTSLDVSKNTALKYFFCSKNQLTSLDVSKNTELMQLGCSSNHLTSIDISKNVALTSLECGSNQLTSLDISKNTVLTHLHCSNSRLTSLDLTKNTALTSLICENDQLTTLDVSINTALKYLYCSKNQLTSLDVSNNTALIELGFAGNKLTLIDVSKNIALEMLECSDNQLTSLEVSKNTALINLGCMNNQLTTLDMSNNTALTYVQCQYNQLTTLDVAKNTALTNLHCESNQIKDDAMDALINSLPTVESGTFVVVNKQSRANEGNICTKEQVATAKARGWKVMAHTDAGYAEYAGSDTQEVDPTKVIEATCKQVIDGPDGAIYRVTGVCKEIKNTTYGNWYLEDETGTIYIYGTVDSNGQYPRYTSWESFGINVGDTITVQGPKKTYANTPELVDVQVLRPLTLLSGDRININCEERVDTIRLYCEGDSYEVEIPADATWVTIKEQTTGKDPIIVLHIDENKGVSRGTAINISSTIKGQKYEKTVLVTQHPYYFKAKTVEGVELSYRVVTETPTKTCYVSGAGEDLYAYYAALDSLTTGHVTIPAEVNGYTVTGIDFHAFENCKNITGVTMPETMTVIDSYAFKGCTSLADIHFSSSLNSLGAEIFEGSVWFANQPDGAVYINDSLLYVYKGEMPADTHFEVKEGCTYIGYSAFKGQSNLTGITLPETVKTIEGFAFSQTGLKEVTIPASCKMVQQRSFYRCSELESVIILGQPEMRNTIFSLCPNLKSVKCYSDKPWDNVYTSCFYYRYEDKDDNSIYQRATLYVPHGSKEAYQAVAPWSEFQNIVEMDLAPIDNGANVNIGSEINTDTNLDGNVVNNVLYNISSDNGSYDATEGCLVINKSTSDDTMSALEGKDIFGEDFQGQFTGVVFKVAEGSGTVKVQAETTGTMLLKVKIGNNAPVTMELEGKLKVSFGYDVTEETNVYIYAGTPTSQAKGLRKAKGASDNALKIYGIEVVRTGPSGIEDVSVDEGPQDVYSLSGQKIRSQAKNLKGLPAGVYIVGGKKVFVK